MIAGSISSLMRTPLDADFITDQKAIASDTLIPFFTKRQRWLNRLGVSLWLIAFLFFWTWWLQPNHYISFGRYSVSTFMVAWITLLPGYFIFVVANAKITNPSIRANPRLRVATVVTKAPAEPLAVVRKTLEGALNQKGIQHDTWLADEAPDAATVKWCQENGVKLSSRYGVTEYQQDDWPRRKHSKEGNLSYFYDKYAYRYYDVVSQFDADHVPETDYLLHAIAPFQDPAVGYVSAPSICDSNSGSSWSARGRLFIEATMHGAVQTGYNNEMAPICIGSHYSLRTKALKEIGGLGPELAEDHSTTLFMNAAGWRGVHALKATAHGEGPETFADLCIQEFQWARSLVTILLKYSPKLLPRLPWRLRLQFGFAQLWYPLYSVTLALMFFMPIYALSSGLHMVNVTYIDFIIHILPLTATFVLLAYWWRSTGLFRPVDAPIFSWEGAAFIFLRWPWMLLGSIMAIYDVVRGGVADFRITPKGVVHTDNPVPLMILAPYILISLAASYSAWSVVDPGTASGFYIFNLANAFSYALLVLLILWRHARENSISLYAVRKNTIVSIAGVSLSMLMIVGASYQNGPKGVAAMMKGINAFTLTETVFPVAGAGDPMGGQPITSFKFEWHGFGAPDEQTRREISRATQSGE